MSKPSIIAFDLGKVLVDFDFAIAARRILARSQHPPERLQELIQTSPLLVCFECGQITNEQFYEEVRRATGYQGTSEEFAAAFADIFTEIPNMVRLHARLRAAGYTAPVTSLEDAVNDYVRNYLVSDRRLDPAVA